MPNGPMKFAQASQASQSRSPKPKVQRREASGFVVRLGAIRCEQVRLRWRTGYTAEYRYAEYADYREA